MMLDNEVRIQRNENADSALKAIELAPSSVPGRQPAAMPFHFTCPYCFHKTLVDESLDGQTGPCANCGKQVTVLAPAVREPEQAHPVSSDFVRPEAMRNSNQGKLWVVKAAGLAVVTGVLGACVLFLLWPVLQSLKQRRDAVACMNNASQIARALTAYAQDYGTFPPPTVFDSAGKPMHSWRVLVLPYLGEDALYAQYDFKQPWDGTNNIDLFDQCPDIFVSPATLTPGSQESSYMLITGQGTLFPSSGPLRPTQIFDGPEKTLLLVEVDNNVHEWTKPIDLDVGKLNPRIGATGPNSIGGHHVGGATAAFANGEPAWLPADTDPVLLDAAISPTGGEPIEATYFELDK